MPFDTTHWSVIYTAQGTGESARAAMATIYTAYRGPILAYIRMRGGVGIEAEDLLQGFFAEVIERRYLDVADATKGRFRSFLLTCLKHYLSHEGEKARAQKRGGGMVRVMADEAGGDGGVGGVGGVGGIADPAGGPDADFDRNWALTIMERALARLGATEREAGRGAILDAVGPQLLTPRGDIDYGALSGELEMSPNALKVAVHRMRGRFRDHIREEVRLTVASPGDVDDELALLLDAVRRR